MRLRLAVALCTLLIGVGCAEAKPDDELVRPTVTVTVAPEAPRDLPDLPTGGGAVGPGEPVRADGMTLLVGERRINLAPLKVDDFVVVEGGVYFLNQGELWFTDLSRARATAYSAVAELALSDDGSRLTFRDQVHATPDTDGTPRQLDVEFDAVTGRFLGASYDTAD